MAFECILEEHHPKNALLLQLPRAFSVPEIPRVMRLLLDKSTLFQIFRCADSVTHSAFENKIYTRIAKWQCSPRYYVWGQADRSQKSMVFYFS
jgi:hypothetical protein